MTNRSIIAEQRELWSSNPRDWAEIAEPENRQLYDELLDLTGVGPGTRLLDIACGSGYAVALAAARGAEVTGVDIAPALLEIARERTPDGNFIEGEMDALPLADSRFDVVTAVNGFQFALDPATRVRRGRARTRRREGGWPRPRSPSPSATRAPRCTSR